MATENQDYFKELAQRARKRNEEEQKNRGSGGQSFSPLLWTAFEDVGSSKVIRFYHDLIAQKKEDLDIVDGQGNKIFDKYAPRTVNMATLYGDDHKKFYAYVPEKSQDPGHFFWRMYDLILKKEWIPDPDNKDKKISKLIHQGSHPELVDRFLTNGFNHNISKNKFDRGWKPQRVVVANVIDRSMMDEHREHKHSFLLSKNVNFYEGNAFYDIGIPSYGFVEQVLDVISIYGGLTSYDLLIERTGEKGTPWKVRNGSRYIEEVPEKLRGFVRESEGLTEEEKSWELYDIESMYKPSSYRKWFSKIKVLAKQIDLAFNTHFHEELEEKANKEKEEYEAWKKENEAINPTQGVDVEEKKEPVATETSHAEEPPKREKQEEAPSRKRTSSRTEEIPITWESLESFGYKGKEGFTEEVASLIERITPDGDVVWKEGTGTLMACFDGCNYKGNSARSFESPDNNKITHCLWCNEKY